MQVYIFLLAGRLLVDAFPSVCSVSGHGTPLTILNELHDLLHEQVEEMV
jgi:hypothetical protein